MSHADPRNTEEDWGRRIPFMHCNEHGITERERERGAERDRDRQRLRQIDREGQIARETDRGGELGRRLL